METREPGARAAWIMLLCALAIATIVRVHRFDLPLERDEGEYAYGARLVLEGDFNYDALRTLKLPGVHVVLAPFLWIFGPTPAALRAALLCCDLGSALALFLLVRAFLGAWTAALAGAALAWTQLSLTVLGLFAHAENFALLPALLGLVAGVRTARGGGARTWWWSGLAFGVAYLMKQPAIVFAPLALVAALYATRRTDRRVLVSRVALFGFGCALPYLLVCAWMASSGHFEAFWFSTVTYARAYGSGATWTQGWMHISRQTLDALRYQAAFGVLAGLGIVVLARQREERRHLWLFAGLALAGIVAASVGLYFRAHYFVLLLPASSIAAALGAQALGTWLLRADRSRARASAGFVVLAAVTGGWLERDVLWTEEPAQVSRRLYFPNPFADSAQLAEIIRQRTRPIDTVAVLGSEPQIPFLADRRSATGFVYMYPLLEEHEHAAWMQERAIAEIEAAKPRIVLVVNVRISWLRRPNSVTRIYEWYPQYLQKLYHAVGLLDLTSPQGSRWIDANAPASEVQNVQNCVMVYERNADK